MNSNYYLGLEMKNLLAQNNNLPYPYNYSSNNPYVGHGFGCSMCGGCGDCPYCGGAVGTQLERQQFEQYFKTYYPKVNRSLKSQIYQAIPKLGMSVTQYLQKLESGELQVKNKTGNVIPKFDPSAPQVQQPLFPEVPKRMPPPLPTSIPPFLPSQIPLPPVTANIEEFFTSSEPEEKKQEVAQEVQKVFKTITTQDVPSDVAEKVAETITKVEEVVPNVEQITNYDQLEKAKALILREYAECIAKAPKGKKREMCKHLTFSYMKKKLAYAEAVAELKSKTSQYKSWAECITLQKQSGVPLGERRKFCYPYSTAARKKVDALDPSIPHKKKTVKRRKSTAARNKKVAAKAKQLKKSHPHLIYSERLKLARTLV